MSTRLHWEYANVCNPYVDKLMKINKDMILFDGHFYLEDGAMPVYRICSINGNLLLVKILEKKSLKNTSEYFPYSDEDNDSEDRVCHFPSAIIELKIKILRRLNYRDEEYQKISKLIEDAEKDVQEKSKLLWKERENREHIEAMKHFKISTGKTPYFEKKDEPE